MFSQNIGCEDAKQLLSEENGQLVDVRTPMEYAQGCLPEAVNVPLQSIQSANELLDRERPIILYCVSGARTRMAKSYLESMGFENVHDLGSFRNFMSC
ncbi:MAG: rhodanese-like domain-containing protein [Gammaproteobacteria bacterium]|jgi:phage shock protein E|nr:rhodanese-like domain-containing protein [Gammaproteobacteria bacterium]MBT7306566.1 rhodanese-like domain-containing protein [Gammaproteobacteria bacterium]